MISELTVRENIQHSASIRLPTSWSSKEVSQFTQAIVDALDLAHVADINVGKYDLSYVRACFSLAML